MTSSISVKAGFNGHSMVGGLERVLVCSPERAEWGKHEVAERWRELGFRHEPDFAVAQAQHEKLCQELGSAEADIVELPAAPGLTLDAVYAHDASLPTDFGLIVLRPGKANRIPESALQKELCQKLEIPVLGEVVDPGRAEAGDMVWIDPKTLLIGRGFRTNKAGIGQIREMLKPFGVEVISAPLPFAGGPRECLHLMSLMSLLNEKTALVDLPWLAVETVELLKARGFRLIEIDYSERETLACNVLALGGDRLLAIEENKRTNTLLRAAGFDVRAFPGSELCINGGGGPTCLTRPILRS